MMIKKALSGIRVLDLTRVLAGPYCSMLFADLGAEVIKIEPPQGEMIRDNPPRVKNGKGGPHDRSRSAYFLSLNRNKLGVTLNLKHPKAVKMFKDLVKTADIVLENYAPGVMKRLGIDYPVLKEINPRIILCSISGFGQWGPYSQKTAFDIVAQAAGGLMSVTGMPGSPPIKVGTSIGDLNAAVHGAFAIMAALWYREKSGAGQHIDVSMQEAMVSVMEGAVVRWTVGHELMQPIGSHNTNESPMAAYRCKDGYIIIGTVGNEHFQRFCRAIGKPEWVDRPEYATKGKRWARKWEMQKEIEEITVQYTIKEVGEMMDRERVANAPILNIQQVVEDPHLNARGYFLEVEHPIIGKAKIPGFAFKLSETPGSIDRPSPLVGEHNEEVFRKYLGLGKEEIEKLKNEGAI
ncbi:MAG: carnitine dehydratase [Deltaproteobacteria bacterium]|nr:carnitine dehydratase [Deltaproteobacteria bacterium]